MSYSDNVTNGDLGVFEAEIQRLVDKIKDLEDDMRRAEVLADSQQEAYYYNILVEEEVLGKLRWLARRLQLWVRDGIVGKCFHC